MSLVQLHVVTGNNIMLPKEKQSKDMAVKYAEEMIRIRPKAPFAHQLEQILKDKIVILKKQMSFIKVN